MQTPARIQPPSDGKAESCGSTCRNRVGARFHLRTTRRYRPCCTAGATAESKDLTPRRWRCHPRTTSPQYLEHVSLSFCGYKYVQMSSVHCHKDPEQCVGFESLASVPRSSFLLSAPLSSTLEPISLTCRHNKIGICLPRSLRVKNVLSFMRQFLCWRDRVS